MKHNYLNSFMFRRGQTQTHLTIGKLNSNRVMYLALKAHWNVDGQKQQKNYDVCTWVCTGK